MLDAHFEVFALRWRISTTKANRADRVRVMVDKRAGGILLSK